MRKLFLIGLISFGLILGFGMPALASFTWVQVDGEVEIGVGKFHGNLDTGGFAVGEADAEYWAIDPTYAEGEAGAMGCLKAWSFDTGNFAISVNKIGVASYADADGFISCAAASGGVMQANWASVGGPSTYAFGVNASGASYEGEYCWFCGAGIGGLAATGGMTIAYQYSNPTTNGACALTKNGAIALGPNSDVWGEGEVGTGAMNGGAYGGGVAESYAQFSYDGNIAGAGKAGSHSHVTYKQGCGGASVSAYTTSFAEAHAI